MDLGLEGRKALICAASKGLGYAAALRLAHEGVDVVISARREGPLLEAADAIRDQTGRQVTPVVADSATREGVAALLSACPDPDILITNAGGPPAGDFRKFDRDDWIKALEANMLGAIDLIRGVVDPMVHRKFGRVLNIASSGVKVPLAILPLSNGARAGLIALSASIAGNFVSSNVTINNVLVGPFDTDRFAETIRAATKHSGRTEAEERIARIESSPAKRVGRPEEFGAFCAFMCSEHTGYITGQSIMMDGGRYPTTL